MNEIKTMDARKTKNNGRKGKKMEVGGKKNYKGKSKQEDSRKSEIKAFFFFFAFSLFWKEEIKRWI